MDAKASPEPVAPAPAPRPLTGGVVMSATSRITVAVTGAITTIFVARLLGPSGTGSFAVAITLIFVITALTTLGVQQGIAYYVSSRRWAAGDARRTAQRLALCVGIVAAAVALGLRLAVPSAFGGLTVAETAVVVTAAPFALSWFYVGYVALAIDRYEAYVIPPAAQSAIAMALVVVLGLVAELPGALVALTASHAAVAIGLGVWAARRIVDGDGDGSPRQLRRAISFGIKGYVAVGLQLLNHRLDLFVLSAVAGAAAVGQLSVAIAVTGVLLLLPMALSEVLFPRVAALSAGGESGHDLRQMVESKSLRHAILVIAAGTAVLAVALILLVVPVYGARFRPAIELGLILLPGTAAIGITQVMAATVVGRGKPLYTLYTALIVTPITVALYLILVPRLEAEGAALAKTISYLLSFAVILPFYRLATGSLSISLFVPTRSEIDDLRRLPAAIRTWAAARRR